MWLIDFFASFYPLYRAQEDASGGFIMDNAAIQNYILCWAIDRAVQDRDS